MNEECSEMDIVKNKLRRKQEEENRGRQTKNPEKKGAPLQQSGERPSQKLLFD
jgi:hypothetical protein